MSLRLFYVSLLWLIIIVTPSFSSLYGEEQQKNVGIVLSVKGKVIIERIDASMIQAQLGTSIYIGDRIETGHKAFVQIEFLDRSKINLMGSSDVTINDYFFDGSQKSTSDVTIENGAMGFMAGKISKVAPQNYKIQTITATIGIRGSSGELETSNGELPGIPRSLKVMKTGGIGLTLSLREEGAQAVEDILESGTGVIVDADHSVERVRFKESVLKSYFKTKEAGIKQGRQESGTSIVPAVDNPQKEIIQPVRAVEQPVVREDVTVEESRESIEMEPIERPDNEIETEFQDEINTEIATEFQDEINSRLEDPLKDDDNHGSGSNSGSGSGSDSSGSGSGN